jgi:phenylacetate-CoA ligase
MFDKDKIFKECILPSYYKLKGLNRLNYYAGLKGRDKLSIHELKVLQYYRLKKLIEHCYKNIPYYKTVFSRNNITPDDIKSLKDFSDYVPVLTKQDIKENFEQLIDSNLPKNQICYDSTSGSTGIPLQLIRSLEDQEFGFALRYRSNAWCGWEYFHKSVWFVSDTRHIKELDKVKGKMSLWAKRRLLINTKQITKENMFNWANQIIKFKPEFVYGYSSLLSEFAEFLLENNIKLSGIKGVFSTAEVLRDRQKLFEAFDAPVYDQYGASEVPCIAHECKKGGMHINIDEVLLEFENLNDDSNIKKVICTPLYLYGMPLLRYELQDAAVPLERNCDCGLPYPVMELRVGRTSDNLISPTGKIVSGITLGWYITDATRGIKQYQIIQEELSEFIVRLSLDKTQPHNEQNAPNIAALLYEMLETSEISIKFEYVDAIKPSKNGKIRPIISNVMNNSSQNNICSDLCSGKAF